jgi:O-methyltransferase domain
MATTLGTSPTQPASQCGHERSDAFDEWGHDTGRYSRLQVDSIPGDRRYRWRHRHTTGLYPQCFSSSKGVLFDQSRVGAESISHNRMEVIGGNFFESVPTGADAYLLRWILHDWAEPEAAAILGSLRRAMKPTARLILVEDIIPEGATFDLSKWIDLQMLVCLGGRERTETEYRALLRGAGFDLQEVVATASPLSLLVAKPVTP